MAARAPSKKRASKGRGGPALPVLPRLPVLAQRHLDVLGLALVALGTLLACVFYLGLGGGRVGDALAGGAVWLLGGVGYLTPLLLFGAGSILVLSPMLPAVRPFRSGTVCLVAALVLGLAGGLFGLGPEEPARDRGFEDAAFFRVHGGIVGEALYWITRTLVSDLGAHIAFVFLLLAGVLLLTGASVAGVIVATRAGLRSTGRRIGQATSELTAVVSRDAPGDAAAPTVRELPPGPEPEPEAAPPEVEPTIRAVRPRRIVRDTHVEAPAVDEGEEEEQEARQEPSPTPTKETTARPDPEPFPDEDRAGGDGGDSASLLANPPPEPGPARSNAEGPAEKDPTRYTPQGHLRTSVTEAEDIHYTLPSPRVLKRSTAPAKVDDGAERRTGALLVEALGHFGVDAKVIGAQSGPHVTRYELRLAPGTKMSKVATLKDDLAYALAATDVRILAPIPGKTAVGIEVPNLVRRMVHLGDVWQDAPEGWSPLTVWLGKDIAGKAIGTDLARQPHVLVAGTTGSGKSGCVNAMLSSILLSATPREVKLVLVDPKQVELNHYESIPHLLTPVVTSPRQAANVLANLIREMEQRYGIMSLARARNLVELNRAREARNEAPLPYILCVIDELADLMMVAPADVEDAIIRLAQKSRAVGIHLLLATQRPSADIITGMIKANVPARIAFAVSSQTDSRVILDQGGAESLLGQGDMLFRPASESRTSRIQGAFIGEDEIERLTDHWRRQGEPELAPELLEAVEPAAEEAPDDFDADADEYLPEAIATVVQMGTASTSMLQRRLRVGYTRAGRLIDMMERRGVISGYEGSKARQVLVAEADLPRVLAALDEPAGAPAAQPAGD